MERLMPYLLVGLGSFVGGNARFILAPLGGRDDRRAVSARDLPHQRGRLVRCSGSWAGLLATRTLPHADSLRLALGVGFCGGFTTFSTFEYETNALFEDGVWLPAVTNMFLSLFAGLLAVRFGIVAAKSWL